MANIAAAKNNAEHSVSKNHLSLLEKIGYSFGDMASNLYFQIFIIFLPGFYTDVFGMPAAAMGTLLILTRVFDAVIDPVMGNIADKTNTRWGKFRPYIVGAAVPFAIIGVLAFSTPGFDTGGKIIYAYITYSLLMLFYTIVNIPYSALMGVITPNSMERTSLSSYRFVGAFMGGLIIKGSVLPMVSYFGNGNKAVGWTWTMTIIGVLAVILLFVTFITTKERVVPVTQQKSDTKLDLKDLLKNKAWLCIGGATVFQLIFIVMQNSAIVYYFKYYIREQQLNLFGNIIHLSVDSFTSSFILIGTAFNILGAILTKWIASRFDKKYSYIGSLIISAVFCMAYYVVHPQNMLLIYLINIIVSFVWGPVSVLQWAMYADAADYSEWKNNRRATGLTMAASLFALKLGLALGSGFLGWILAFYNFVPNQTQTESTTNGIVMLMSVFPAVFGLIGAGIMFLYPLTNKMMIEIEHDLTHRREKA